MVVEATVVIVIVECGRGDDQKKRGGLTLYIVVATYRNE